MWYSELPPGGVHCCFVRIGLSPPSPSFHGASCAASLRASAATGDRDNDFFFAYLALKCFKIMSAVLSFFLLIYNEQACPNFIVVISFFLSFPLHGGVRLPVIYLRGKLERK